MDLSRRSFLKVAGLTALAAIVVPEIIIAEIEKPHGLVVKQGTASLLYEIGVSTPNGGRVIVLRGQPTPAMFGPPPIPDTALQILRLSDHFRGGMTIWQQPPDAPLVTHHNLHVVTSDPQASIYLVGRDQNGEWIEEAWAPGQMAKHFSLHP